MDLTKKLSLKKFKNLTVQQQKEWLKNADTEAKDETVFMLVSQSPNLLLEHTDVVDFNQKDIVLALNNIEMFKELIDTGVINQDSINYKFKSTDMFWMAKILMDYVSLNNKIKTKVILSLIHISANNQNNKFSYLKKMIKQGNIDWDVFTEDFIENGLFTHVLGNYETYKPFCLFLIQHPKFDINAQETNGMASAPISEKIWKTFDPELIIALLKRDDYVPTNPADHLDNGNIVESFDDWKASQVEEFLNALYNFQEFSDYIIENKLEELYPQEIKDVFLF